MVNLIYLELIGEPIFWVPGTKRCPMNKYDLQQKKFASGGSKQTYKTQGHTLIRNVSDPVTHELMQDSWLFSLRLF